ncbi:metaxin-2-like [Ornithodoros turicata]|uniref:Putative mitochondrial outer membrane protein n=1 Tax=Ornithodoros turicata TaxID=34597 RepID=A0A2R5LJS1_9ACAR
MPSVLLTESIAVELGGQEPWPEDAKLFQSFEKSQILLPESTASLSVQTYLRMVGLDHEVEMRPNVESISPSGNAPVLKCGNFVISEMDPIVAFVNTKGIQLNPHLTVQQKADMRAYMSLVNTVLVNAELYICWEHKETYSEDTQQRYGSVFPWPLNHFLCFKKRRQVAARLAVADWRDKSLEDVLEEVQTCCAALSERLGNQRFFFGEKPTELDALVFGHLYTLMMCSLLDNKLARLVRGFVNLVDLCRRIEVQYFAET